MPATENMLPNFYCETCDYGCFKKSSWTQHTLTAKHLKAKNGLIQANKKYACDNCHAIFKHQSSYSRHKKKCIIFNNVDHKQIDTETILDKDLIVMLLTQNNEMMSIIKSGIVNNNTTNNNNNNNNNNTNNSHNTTNNVDAKTFNLNFFLNETCKDAMNISEFVSSIKVNIQDLENTGKQGYIQGISNIILKNLNELEQSFRPIHCSDSKREVFYIKENDEWQKEYEQKPLLTKAIKVIANENIKQIKHWVNKHPDCRDPDSKKNNAYLKIVSNSMNGLTEEEGNKNINKIISNIAKESIIDKSLVLL
jgi:hypothetical protein